MQCEVISTYTVHVSYLGLTDMSRLRFQDLFHVYVYLIPR